MRFTPLSGTDVVVGADIPYMDYGKESVWNDPWATWIYVNILRQKIFQAPNGANRSTILGKRLLYVSERLVNKYMD